MRNDPTAREKFQALSPHQTRVCSREQTFRIRIRARFLSPCCSLPQPTREHDEFVDREQYAEDRLIMSCEPVRQKNVKVVLSLICEAACPICQGTTASIQGEDATLSQDQHGQDRSPIETMHQCRDRQRQNAPSKESPNDCMQKFDRGENRDPPGGHISIVVPNPSKMM